MARADDAPQRQAVLTATRLPQLSPRRARVQPAPHVVPTPPRRPRATRAMLARGGMLSGVHPILAAKAHAIVSACGATVISGRRHTRVAGTRRLSLHASGRAVDLRGSPSCIYAHLHGWPGGYSTDYGRVRHVHVSWGGPEHGLRFAHHLPRHRVRYAALRG